MTPNSQDATGDVLPPPGEAPKPRRSLRIWLKRIGIAGFLFFLLKGLAWLFVIWGGARMLGCKA